MRYKCDIPILNTQLAMGAIAEGDQHAIWPLQQGRLLVHIQDDPKYTVIGFLSATAIRTMVKHGWLEVDGVYSHITATGRAAAARDFVGALKLPRRRKFANRAEGSHFLLGPLTAPMVIPGLDSYVMSDIVMYAYSDVARDSCLCRKYQEG